MTSPFLENKEKIFENSVGFVIYDKFPVNKGHCLIIPKREYADYFDSSKEEIEGLNKLLFQTKDTSFFFLSFNITYSPWCPKLLHIYSLSSFLDSVTKRFCNSFGKYS